MQHVTPANEEVTMPSTVSRDILARAFLYITRNPREAAQAGGLRTAIEVVQDPHFEPSAVRVRADVACVAIQLANAIVAQPDLLESLLNGDPVVAVTVPDKEWIEIAETLFEELFAVNLQGIERRMSVFTASGTPKISYRGPILDAIAAGQAVFGLRTASQDLDETLVQAVDHDLELPAIDPELIARVIEAVTGEAPVERVDAKKLADLPLSGLSIAIRSQWSAAQCMERLNRSRVAPVTTALPERSIPKVEDLAGYGKAKDWAVGAVDDLKAWTAGELTWEQTNARILLSGAPGVGKTLLARVVAVAAGVRLIETSIADWNAEKYLNGTLGAIKRLFAEARKAAPCVFLIDEIDGLSDRTRLRGEYVEYWSQIINAVLVELNEPNTGVIIIAATNFPERVDAAVLRSGRLDQHIRIELPGPEERVEVFRHHLRGDLADEDLTDLSWMAVGCSGADIEACVRRGRVVARRAGRPFAIEDIKEALTAAGSPLSPAERRRVAVHEAGHILASWVLGVGRLDGATINGKGGATVLDLGFRGSAVLADVENHLIVLLAGRAAEVAVLGSRSIGAGGSPTSDLAQATVLALAIECEYGVGELGAIYGPAEAGDVMRNPILFGAVRKRLASAEMRASALMEEHRGTLDTLAGRLNELGYLSAADIADITGSFESRERLAS